MKLLDRMERRIGKFAINRLMIYVIACYIIGYVIYYVNPSILSWLTLEPYLIFHYAQIWRLISWVLMPPSSTNIIFVVIMLILYYQLGTALERTWGAFRFNCYIFGGILFSIVSALVMYGIYAIIYGADAIVLFGSSYSTTYINMSIFLAFAAAFPEQRIMLYFFIPIKMKWMGLVYAALMVYEFVVAGSIPGRIAIVASLANFLIYFLATRSLRRFSPREIKRRRDFKRGVSGGPERNSRISSSRVNRASGGSSGSSSGSTSVVNDKTSQYYTRKGSGPIHKCAVCGRTELDDPNLTFRYCSKCNGNYEYCQDHLFTHEHIK